VRYSREQLGEMEKGTNPFFLVSLFYNVNIIGGVLSLLGGAVRVLELSDVLSRASERARDRD